MKPLKCINIQFLFIIMLIFMSISSSLLCFFSFRTLHLNQQKQHHETIKPYQIIAGSLAFVQPVIILFVTLLIFLCKDQKYYSKALFILKDYINMNFFIGFGRVAALMMTCFQSSQISDKSSVTGFYAIVGLLGGSFCLAEYMSVLEALGVMKVGVGKELGFLEINIACALCAIQNLYGLGKCMIIVFFTCMFLHQLHHGVVFPCSHDISKNDQNSSSIEHDLNNGVDAGVQVPASNSIPV